MSLMTESPAKKTRFDQLPKYRAPRNDRQSLVSPPLTGLIERSSGRRARSVSDLADCGTDASQFGLSQSGPSQLGRWALADQCPSARVAALKAAIEHTEAYRDLWFDKAQYIADTQSCSRPWVVAGHQPELFHSGVWFKNFLLSEAARVAGTVSLNLVIDNDLCRAPGIRVPTRGANNNEPLRTESVMFDAPSAAVAWECRPLVDTAFFDSFPSRVRQLLIRDAEHPLVDQLWQHARAASRRSGRLGLAIAEARHALEGTLGLQTLELPLSRLCEQASFAKFSLEVLRQLPRFRQIYNDQRAAYRTANSIRSESHPVQALSEKHGWLEAPWWVYRSAAPTRKRVFARLEGENLLLSDQAGWQAMIEGPLDEDDAVAQWQEFSVDGVLLRPRALITTMFARLIISDLFLHGIGGGKYDQLTDAIIRDFFGIEPPAMCVATATLQLPGTIHIVDGTLAANQAAIQREAETLRNLRYHPEEHVTAPDDETQQLLNAKQELLRAIPPRGEKWQWHREITRINARLALLNQEAMRQSEQRQQALAARERQLKLAHSREFSFCLFELPYVAETLKRLAQTEFDRPSGK